MSAAIEASTLPRRRSAPRRPHGGLWPSEESYRVVVLAGRKGGEVFYRVVGTGRRLEAGIAHRVVGPTGRLFWLMLSGEGRAQLAPDHADGRRWREFAYLGEGEIVRPGRLQ